MSDFYMKIPPQRIKVKFTINGYFYLPKEVHDSFADSNYSIGEITTTFEHYITDDNPHYQLNRKRHVKSITVEKGELEDYYGNIDE